MTTQTPTTHHASVLLAVDLVNVSVILRRLQEAGVDVESEAPHARASLEALHTAADRVGLRLDVRLVKPRTHKARR